MVGLYPHIPHDEGLGTLRWAMENDGEMPIDWLNWFWKFEDKVFIGRNWVRPLGLSLLRGCKYFYGGIGGAIFGYM